MRIGDFSARRRGLLHKPTRRNANVREQQSRRGWSRQTGGGKPHSDRRKQRERRLPSASHRTCAGGGHRGAFRSEAPEGVGGATSISGGGRVGLGLW